jgi:hypothetical protein
LNANDKKEIENPYLIMGFWEFAITATLMTVFFPWSLLFCVVFDGFQNTKFLIIALLHDLVKTVFAILAVILPLVIGIIALIFVFAE